MNDTTPTQEEPTQEEIRQTVSEFMVESDREKRLHDLIGKLPNKRIIACHNGGLVIIAQSWNSGRVDVQRDVIVVGGSAVR